VRLDSLVLLKQVHLQVYGSVVANRFSNQHILPLTQMTVSAECYYQPSVDAAFDEDSEQMELGWYRMALLLPGT
jgi:hypothetical protein